MSKKLCFQNTEELQQFLQDNLLTKDEASAITNQSSRAFSQSVSYGKLKPFFESEGKGPGKVRLYLKEDVEHYRDTMKKTNK